ncbi:alpha/beta hydrolase [Caenimonas koreensis]|uniref:Alpha/beta fold hydrolase n=1 Tax=Caenimonas koreensis DSM 17982 TaxID=1121255 RepID=A0A844BFH7_9BURK|nr:alpha/beta hydrolase [Caenimonas koreensis]MRD49211.1 alpha/beta fold hydrolase [Caenimonas koreensis DSM 17982]
MSGAAGWFDGFNESRFAVNGTEIFARFGGAQDKPALLLLHGFPQTHAIWHRIAQQLKNDYFLVMPDLRGYGDSVKVPGLEDHSNYSKRAMAQDMVGLMDLLQTREFFVCGHDRGARVAHRLAVDHPQAVRKLCLIDIAPTLDMYDMTSMTFARYYYHWFHLIQPSPLPEAMIGPNAKMYLHAKLGGWGAGGLDYIEPRALAEYERCFCRAESIHAACEDYRASAGIDLDHDRESRARGEKIQCDTHLLWGQRGLIDKLFKPIELWQAQCAGKVTGHSVPAGHFIPEELHAETAKELRAFFG